MFYMVSNLAPCPMYAGFNAGWTAVITEPRALGTLLAMPRQSTATRRCPRGLRKSSRAPIHVPQRQSNRPRQDEILSWSFEMEFACWFWLALHLSDGIQAHTQLFAIKLGRHACMVPIVSRIMSHMTLVPKKLGTAAVRGTSQDPSHDGSRSVRLECILDLERFRVTCSVGHTACQTHAHTHTRRGTLCTVLDLAGTS
eukprot:COSAG02_NODE_2086_length_9880_cov_35.550250_2_plen_198_part_00